MTAIRIHPDVVRAASRGDAVVALETAVLTHGLPRTPMPAPPCCASILAGSGHAWDAARPANVELARAVVAAVRAGGATPATIGMLRGELVIGLNDDELLELGAATDAAKLSSRDLAGAHVARASGGTTVAGTLAALQLAARSLAKPIRVFATGGIGGVHRGWTDRPDVSADLPALASTPVCVVSAGAKSILDLPATLEWLDTFGVPVLGLGTPWFPRFYSEGAAPLAVQRQVASVDEAAAICAAHWNSFASSTAVVVANPPGEWAIPLAEVERAIETGLRELESRGVRSAEVTPALLAHVARATGGRSVDANVAVLLSNARVAASLARRL
ncbi:MAG: pseudouridine-5'-phosphate glycosidase [Phycisphaerales bacterium]